MYDTKSGFHEDKAKEAPKDDLNEDMMAQDIDIGECPDLEGFELHVDDSTADTKVEIASLYPGLPKL